MFLTTARIIWVFVSGKFKTIFSALQITGRMTLTNYMLQNIISFILFMCLKLNWGLPCYLLTGFIIYILQIFFSKWWLSKYNFGPIEWLWRCLSYGQLFSLKKNKGMPHK